MSIQVARTEGAAATQKSLVKDARLMAEEKLALRRPHNWSMRWRAMCTLGVEAARVLPQLRRTIPSSNRLDCAVA